MKSEDFDRSIGRRSASGRVAIRSLKSALADFLIRRRIVVLALVIMTTASLSIPLSELHVGYSIRSFLASEEPQLKEASAHYAQLSVPDNLLLFAFPVEDPFSEPSQATLQRLVEGLDGMPQVKAVHSLISAPMFGRRGEPLQESVQRSSTWRDMFVSRSGDALGGMMELTDTETGGVGREDFFDQLQKLAGEVGTDLKLAGIPHQRNAIIRYVKYDQQLFIPLGFAVTAVLLLWLIPHMLLALLALAVVPFTLVSTFGVMGLMGIDITLWTSTLPILLMAMAAADGVHLVGRFVEERRRGLAPPQAAKTAIRELLSPCFLTSLTTAVGFFTLTFTSIPDMQHMGYFAALGVGFAYVFTVLVMPAALSFVHGVPGRQRFDFAGVMTAWATRIGKVRPSLILMLVGLLLLLCGWGAMGVDRNQNLRENFWPDSPAQQSTDYYESRFVSVSPTEVLVTSEKGFGDSETRSTFAELIEWLEARESISRSLSILDLKRDGVPSLLLPSVAQGRGLLMRDGKTARILVFQADLGTQYMRQFIAEVEEKNRSLPNLRVRVAGIGVVATELVDRMTMTLGRSFLGSLGVILLLVWIVFKSFRLGIIAMIPSMFPLVANLAFMSGAGISLRPLTVITFCVAFGLAVDDTLHLLARYREERAAGISLNRSLTGSLETAGRPVVITTFLLLTGFTLLLTSNFKGTFEFGLLVGFALLGSLFGALILLPALVRAFVR